MFSVLLNKRYQDNQVKLSLPQCKFLFRQRLGYCWRLVVRHGLLQVTLISRDEVSMLLVSYADLKTCLESAYSDLKSRAAGNRMASRLDVSRRM